MRLIWSPKALERVGEIIDRIGRDSPEAALRWLEGLEERLRLLPGMPEQGRVVPEWYDPSVREIIHPPYRVLYEVRRETVEVLTVHHEKQHLEPELDP